MRVAHPGIAELFGPATVLVENCVMQNFSKIPQDYLELPTVEYMLHLKNETPQTNLYEPYSWIGKFLEEMFSEECEAKWNYKWLFLGLSQREDGNVAPEYKPIFHNLLRFNALNLTRFEGRVEKEFAARIVAHFKGNVRSIQEGLKKYPDVSLLDHREVILLILDALSTLSLKVHAHQQACEKIVAAMKKGSGNPMHISPLLASDTLAARVCQLEPVRQIDPIKKELQELAQGIDQFVQAFDLLETLLPLHREFLREEVLAMKKGIKELSSQEQKIEEIRIRRAMQRGVGIRDSLREIATLGTLFRMMQKKCYDA
jgi:hypothetical protein